MCICTCVFTYTCVYVHVYMYMYMCTFPCDIYSILLSILKTELFSVDSLTSLIETSRMISKIYISLLKVIAKDDAQLNTELKGFTRATGSVMKLLNKYLYRLGQNVSHVIVR